MNTNNTERNDNEIEMQSKIVKRDDKPNSNIYNDFELNNPDDIMHDM